MISKASGIILALKDADNRSNREQERLKADLAIQKGFLTTHLEQSLQLLKLRQQFLKDKILSLQSINLSLTQEQIALLENQINKFITNAIFNLKQEQKLLTDNLDELHVEMAAFPKKRAAEQLIEHQMVLNQMMVEEITRLVETKNITNNLEKIQSSPLDLPIVPLHPKSPRLILLTLLGAILGAIMSTAWVLATSIAKGVETSAENLRMAGFTVSGSLTNHMERSNAKNVLLDEDLETLRRTMAFITDPQVLNFTNCYLLLHGNGPQFAKNLAELMSKKGLKTLIVDLCFEDYSEAMPGLLQYLEGKTGEVHIQHEQTFDRIVSGGVSRYASELIGATRFAELMEKLSSEYNWVLVVSKALPQSAEAEALYKYFNHAIITVTGQSWSQLKPALDFARHKDHRVSFLMANPQFP